MSDKSDTCDMVRHESKAVRFAMSKRRRTRTSSVVAWLGVTGGFYRIRIPCILHASCMYRACRFDVSRSRFLYEITFVQDDGCGPCVPAHASDATSTCIAGCSLHAFWLGDFAKRSAQNTTRKRARTAASAIHRTTTQNTATQL